MILTPEIEDHLVAMIEQEPTAPLVLPDWAYGPDGRCVVLVEGLPIDLHRHLHELVIGELGYTDRMHDRSGVAGNVNPHLFTVVEGKRSPHTHCSKGHAYLGNEAPPNSRGYRCRTCLRLSRNPDGSLAPGDRTHCPQNHEYSPENTMIDSAGKRRCLICTREQKAAYMRRRRKETS